MTQFVTVIAVYWTAYRVRPKPGTKCTVTQSVTVIPVYWIDFRVRPKPGTKCTNMTVCNSDPSLLDRLLKPKLGTKCTDVTWFVTVVPVYWTDYEDQNLALSTLM